MPKVSVVIPTYNRADLLPECLESVLAQSFRDLEIIVIDDGSTDNTREVVSAFPVRYVWQENQRVAAARNKGIELAHGEYIAFLDSDDALFKDALEKGVEVMDSHPEAAFSFGQAYFSDEEGRIFGLEKPHRNKSCVREGWEELRDYLTYGNHFTTTTVMARRSCLKEAGGFDVAFSIGSSDLELWVRLAKRYAVAYIAEPLAIFRQHPICISKGRSLKEWEVTNGSIIDSVCDDAEIGPRLCHLRTTAYFLLYTGHSIRACKRRDMKTSRDYLYRALRVHPRSFLSGRGLIWIYSFARTLLPPSVLAFARNFKRYLVRAIRYESQSNPKQTRD